MNVHVFQHVPFEGLGAMAPWLERSGAHLTFTRFFAGDSIPPLDEIAALIVLGGPMGTRDEREFPWLRAEKVAIAEAIRRGTKVLGLCLGAQLVAEVLGSTVTRNREREIGWFPVTPTSLAKAHRLGACFPTAIDVFHWHDDTFSLPPGAVHLLRSEACEQQAFAVGDHVLGLQCHLETTEAAARELTVHAPADLAPGPFVQSAAAILSPASRFAAMQPILERVLATFFAKDAA